MTGYLEGFGPWILRHPWKGPRPARFWDSAESPPLFLRAGLLRCLALLRP